MDSGKPRAVHTTTTFRLGALGAAATDRFATGIARLGLKPKHVAVLTALRTAPPASQLDLAHRLGVAPSAMVALADGLESLGAVERVHDPADRRRQLLHLTTHGLDLLAQCDAVAVDIDNQLRLTLGPQSFDQLTASLAKLATETGPAAHDRPVRFGDSERGPTVPDSGR